MNQDIAVFLSYNRQDRSVVQDIANSLERYGLHAWLDVTELRPGEDWVTGLQEAIRRSQTAAVFFGPKGLGKWQKPEISSLLQKAVRRKVPVIPVLLPQAPRRPKIGFGLETKSWVDLRDGITDAGIARLVWGITGKRPTPIEKPRLPGLEINNLPYPPLNDLLKGRDEELRRLEESLTGTDQAAAILQSHAVHGLGGIGKTRLAVEYAWRCSHRYHAALFVRAESFEGLHAGLAALANPAVLHLPHQQDQEENETVGAVVRWLREHPGWLLILDNVDNEAAATAVMQFLPRLAGGHVLITSRLREWSPEIPRSSLQSIPPADAVRFLLDRTKDGREPAPTDAEEAARLAEILGGLPLALEQAAAYIVHHQMRFTDYLQAWNREQERVLRWHDDRTMWYPVSVAVTWQKTASRLRPTARALLRLAAFLAPDPIPARIFEDGESHVEEATHLLCKKKKRRLVLQPIPEVLAELAAYSMITRQGRTFTLHRVVQEVLRNQTSRTVRHEWIHLSLRLLTDISPDPQDVESWPAWELLRPHAAWVIDEADRAGIAAPTARLRNRLGILLLGKSVYVEAERLIRRALEIDEARWGADHPEIADHLPPLAQLLDVTDRRPEAVQLMRRALKINEAAFGADHPNLVTTLNGLAWLLKDTNEFSDAEQMMRRALEIDDAAFGGSHPNVATDLHNLAWLLKDTNRFSEAEELMTRASQIDENTLGPDHPSLARDLNSLAWLLKDTGRPWEAEALMRRALKIDESFYGPDHLNISRDLRSLVWLLRDLSHLSEAEALMRRALEIDQGVLGPDHPHVARDLTSLARLLKDANQLSEADSMMRRAFDILKARLGATHPTTRVMREDLRAFIRSLGPNPTTGSIQPVAGPQ